MSKLTYQDKINIYIERKQGNSIVNISKKYSVRKDVIKYLIRLIDKNGYDISSLQIYYFQDNGLLVLITVSAGSFKEIDKITKNIQLA